VATQYSVPVVVVVYDADDAEPPDSVSSLSVKSGIPVQVLSEYRLNVTVPVGLVPAVPGAVDGQKPSSLSVTSASVVRLYVQ